MTNIPEKKGSALRTELTEDQLDTVTGGRAVMYFNECARCGLAFTRLSANRLCEACQKAAAGEN